MSDWLDRIADDLLRVEARLRKALRANSRADWRDRVPITITASEARTLLHGVMPAPIAVTNRRAPHARVVAGLAVLSGQLIALNDPLRRPEAAMDAAMDLMAELRGWLRIMRWRQACAVTKVNWPVPPAITAIPRLGAAEHPFRRPAHAAQAARERQDLPNVAAGRTIAQGAYALIDPLPRPAPAVQLALDLGAPPSAEVIDLRQHQLNLGETAHGRHAHATDTAAAPARHAVGATAA